MDKDIPENKTYKGKMIQRTLVLVKPDGVQRCLIGEIIKRFENAGIKIIGMKMQWIDKDFAKKHYTEDISIRRGEKVRNGLLDFVSEGPVIAIALEGVRAIENIRKIVGSTEPKSAQPGTIRGDFCHVSFSYADEKNIPVRNIIHASSDEKDAKYELELWFKDDELHSYKTVHDIHLI